MTFHQNSSTMKTKLKDTLTSDYEPGELYPVSMKLSGQTMESLERLKVRTNENNRTRIIATAVRFMDMVLDNYSGDDNVVTILNKKGEEVRVTFLGT